MGERNAMPLMCRSWSGLGCQPHVGQPVEQGVHAPPGSPCGPGACPGRRGRRSRSPRSGGRPGRCRTRRGARTCARPGWPPRAAGRRRRPSRPGTPASSVSRVARRRITVTGGSQRMVSSKASGIRDRSSLHRPQLVGIGQQAVEEVARRPVGGLDPGRQQQAQERVDLLVVESAGRPPRRPAAR